MDATPFLGDRLPPQSFRRTIITGLLAGWVFVPVSRAVADAHRIWCAMSQTPPLRAAPNVPNVVSGNVTPLRPARPEHVRFSVRLSSEAVVYLDSLAERFARYAANPTYAAKRVHTRTVTVTRTQHEQMIEEARMSGVTLNGFIERLLTDVNLDEANGDPNERHKVPGGTFGPVDPITWTSNTSYPKIANPIWGPRGPVGAAAPFPVAPPD